jgi:hypothetical protein
MQQRAREIAVARDPSARHPLLGQTVQQFGQEHLLSADDVLRHMAEVDKSQGGTGEFTRPTERSGRILQHGVEAATMAAPALLAGPAAGAGAIASTGGSAAAGQGIRELGGPEWLATGTEVAGSLASPAEVANLARGVTMLPRTAAAKLMSEHLGSLSADEITRAQNLMEHARAINNPITWAEAGNAVTGGRLTGASDLQRVTEKFGGSDQLAAVMAGRQGAARANVGEQATQIGGQQLQGEQLQSLPRRLGEQARLGVRDVERARTEAVQPYYRQGEMTLPEEMMGHNYDQWTSILQRPAVRDAFREAQNATANRGQQATRWVEFNDNGEITRVRRMPSAAEADAIHKKLQAQIDRSVTPSGKPVDTEDIIAARDAFDQLASGAIPEYAQGRALYRQMTPGVTDVQRGPLGQVMDASGASNAEQQFAQQMKAILPDAPQVTDAATARAAVRRLRQQYDPATGRPMEGTNPALNQAVGQFIRNSVDDAAKQFKTKMTAQDAGAAFKAAISGRTRQAQILQAVVEEAAGPEAWRGFQRMLDVFEAQGFRQAPGSQTTFNQMFREAIEAPRFGMTIPEAATAIGTGGRSIAYQGLKSLEKRGATRRGQATVRNLSDMLLDPGSADIWRQLSTMSPYSPNAARLVARLLATGGSQYGEKGPGPQVQGELRPGVEYQQ